MSKNNNNKRKKKRRKSCFLPQFFIRPDVTVGEQCHSREAHILMINEYLDRSQVRFTNMVDEASNIAEVSCIETIQWFAVLSRRKLSCLSSMISHLLYDPNQTGKSHLHGSQLLGQWSAHRHTHRQMYLLGCPSTSGLTILGSSDFDILEVYTWTCSTPLDCCMFSSIYIDGCTQRSSVYRRSWTLYSDDHSHRTSIEGKVQHKCRTERYSYLRIGRREGMLWFCQCWSALFHSSQWCKYNLTGFLHCQLH